jgi:hypothetical protein
MKFIGPKNFKRFMVFSRNEVHWAYERQKIHGFSRKEVHQTYELQKGA